MKKEIRISDCLDDMDETAMDRVQPKMKSRFGVSNKRIKALTLSRVKGDAPIKSYVPRKLFRMAVAITVAAVLLVTTALAFSGNLLQLFFGAKSQNFDIKTGKVIAVESKNGYTFKVYNAIEDGESALITYTVTKDDGSSFSSGTQVEEFSFSGANSNTEGYSNLGYSELQDDNKTLVGFVKVRIRSLDDSLTITANNLIKVTKGNEISDVDLKEIYDKGSVDVQLLPNTVPSLTLGKIDFSSGEMGFEVNYQKDCQGQILYLQNRNTGELVYVKSNGFFDYISSPFQLSDYKAGVVYDQYETVALSHWSVSVSLEKTKSIVNQVNASIDVDNLCYHFTDVTVSPMGVVLKCDLKDQSGNSALWKANDVQAFTKLDNYLLLKDGTKVKISFNTGHGPIAANNYKTVIGFNIYMENVDLTVLLTSGNIKAFIDYYYSSESHSNPISLLNIQEVTAVVIGGTAIPIQ